jgi:ferritin-like metal-binding protein YciE
MAFKAEKVPHTKTIGLRADTPNTPIGRKSGEVEIALEEGFMILSAHREQMIKWLNDAHAMELSIEKALEDHVKDAGGFPELRDRLEEHLLATRRHAMRMVAAIDKLGGEVSHVRALVANTMGWLEGKSTAMFKDELVKDVLADYAAEQFEVACYTALIAAAEELADMEVAELCSNNLHEDDAMAQWLLAHIPIVTRGHLMEGAVAR